MAGGSTHRMKFVHKWDVLLVVTLILIAAPVVCGSEAVNRPARHPSSVPDILHAVADKLHAFEALKKHDVYDAALACVVNETCGSGKWFDIPKMKEQLLKMVSSKMKENDNCLVDFIWSLENVARKQLWAITMYDSYGKLGSGLTQGNTRWPGSFSLCRNVKQTTFILNASGTDQPFSGRYCWLNFELQPVATKDFTNLSYVPPLQTAICVPDSCTEKILNTAFGKDIIINSHYLRKYLKFAGVSCIPQEHDFWADRKAVICFAVLCIFAILLCVGTAYDAYICLFASRKTNVPYSKMNDSNDVSINDVREGSIEDNGKSDAVTNTQNTTVRVNNENPPIAIRQPSSGMAGQIFLAFSIYTNAKKIFNITPSKESLAPVNGIRFFSMTWVILGHTYLMGSVMTDNLMVLVDVVKTLVFQLVAEGTMSVDSFFVLSGLLLTYLYLKEHEKTGGKISWIKFYVHRYWRLTPPYILVMFLICDGTSKYWSNGPFWPQDGFDTDHCTKSWWWNMLYINNFQPVQDMCMGHTWYLANDMQFYIISPLILIPLTRYFPLAAVAGGTFILAQLIASGVIASHYHITAAIDLDKLAPGSAQYYSLFNNLYDKPYCRIGPYIVGMACGWLLYKSKCKAKLQRKWVVLGWLLAAGCNLSVVFGLYHNNPGIPVSALYLSLSRTAWALGLSWVIFACCNGYGGVVNHILSWPAWNPLSRLTYCAYLWHLTLVNTIIYSSDVMGHFSHTTMIYYYIANVIVSYAGALLLSLAFESPMLALEKLILTPRHS